MGLSHGSVTLLQLWSWLCFFFLVQFRVCWSLFLIAEAVGMGRIVKAYQRAVTLPLAPQLCYAALHSGEL